MSTALISSVKHTDAMSAMTMHFWSCLTLVVASVMVELQVKRNYNIVLRMEDVKVKIEAKSPPSVLVNKTNYRSISLSEGRTIPPHSSFTLCILLRIVGPTQKKDMYSSKLCRYYD